MLDFAINYHTAIDAMTSICDLHKYELEFGEQWMGYSSKPVQYTEGLLFFIVFLMIVLNLYQS